MAVHKLDRIEDVEDIKPLNTFGREIELLTVVDLTNSMTMATRRGGNIPRIVLAQNILRSVVADVAALDSQADAERAAGVLQGEDTAGGVRVIGFGTTDPQNHPHPDDNSHSVVEKAWDFGDFNPENFDRQWARLMQYLHGQFTVIMPGVKKAFEVFKDEFGDRPVNERPVAAITMIIDGEAEDANEVAEMVERLKGDIRLIVVVIGYGSDHDRAVDALAHHAANNPNIVVIAFEGEKNPAIVSDAIVRLIGDND